MNLEELKYIAVLQASKAPRSRASPPPLEESDYADGQTIFAEGDPGDAMFFIVQRRGPHREADAAVDASGRKTLAVLEAGEYFGEMSLFDQKPRSASAVAAGATRLLRLFQGRLRRARQGRQPAGLSVLFAMIRTSGERIRRLNAQVIVYDEIGKAIGESPSLQSLLDAVLLQLCRPPCADWGMARYARSFRIGSNSEARRTCSSPPRNAKKSPRGKSIVAQTSANRATTRAEPRRRGTLQVCAQTGSNAGPLAGSDPGAGSIARSDPVRRPAARPI